MKKLADDVKMIEAGTMPDTALVKFLKKIKFINPAKKKTNVMAFIVLRSMDGKGLIQEAHNKSPLARCCIRVCGNLCCKKRRESLLSRYVYGKW